METILSKPGKNVKLPELQKLNKQKQQEYVSLLKSYIYYEVMFVLFKQKNKRVTFTSEVQAAVYSLYADRLRSC